MEMVTPRIEILEDGATYGKFVAEPLAQGFGYTIGNALRRVLLSSITGAAITSINIEGVLHEFSTIPGVKEDTTELILNLRELYVKMDPVLAADGECGIVTIDVHGPGEVTGADIKCPEGIEVVNPETHIAQLNDETAVLRAELTVEIGKGYVLPDQQERVKQTIGVIPVGAVFCPVVTVSYTVDPCRVGHKTDFDRLVIEVTTNGTVRPATALGHASRILDQQLQLFFELATGSREGEMALGVSAVGMLPGPPDARIEELDFSVRTYNCLKKASILTLRELVQFSEQDLINIRNFGKKSLTEVREKLETLSLSLRPSGDGSELRILPEAIDGEDFDDDDVDDDVDDVDVDEESVDEAAEQASADDDAAESAEAMQEVEE